jgi:hypothetical protein
MITVACVNVQNYEGRGEEYVAKMQSMVARHLKQPHRFECIRTSDKPGWWAKIDLFQPGRFSGRVVYFDLDTVIVGSLDALVQHKGTVHLTDWGWPKNMYGNAIMVWDAGEHEEIYTRYTPAVAKRLRGDNDWMFELGGWDRLPKGLNVSYRYESKAAPPAGAVTVSMHGRPKCHEITWGWVPQHWR